MSKKILYVEDNPENAQLLIRVLGVKGHEIIIAEDGIVAIETAKCEHPDLILMDINLPDMDGYAAAILIKSIAGLNHTPLIALTANVMEGDRERALAAGCDGYIPKPIDVKTFSAQIEEYLNGKSERISPEESSPYLREHNVNLVGQLEKEIHELKLTNAERLCSLERLQERTNELSYLLETTTLMTSSLDLQEILNAATSLLCQKISTTFCRFILLREGRLILKACYAQRALPWSTHMDLSCFLEESDCVRDIRQTDREIFRNWAEIEGFGPCDQQMFTGNIGVLQSLLLLPIIRYGTYVGFLSIGESRRRERAFFTEDKIRLCVASARQIGNAIENASLYQGIWIKSQELKQANIDTIQALAGALETKDVDTKGHSDRTMAYAVSVARYLGLSEQEQEWSRYAALLHDIGKIGIPEVILKKPAKLSPDEFEIMKKHVLYGGMIVRNVKFLGPVVSSVEADHERWDGMGYPRGLKGEEIPIIGRIVAVVDAYDAMTADRIYRKAPGHVYALEELRRCTGNQFDPQVVEAFIQTLNGNRLNH